MLHIQDLSFAYPEQPAIASDWCASIDAGVTQLHGDTGSGKSTLLRVMAGVQPAAGRLTLGGARLDTEPEAYRRSVFFCDPATEAFEQVTGHACTAALGASDARFDNVLWRTLVEAFALEPHLDKPMYMLSTGSKRKVWLAAALASGRPLTLLDEPAGALDAASVRCLWTTLAGLANDPRRAFVIASSARIDAIPLAASIELPLT